MTNKPTELADELETIRNGVDAFNPDARMAARSAFDAAERVWKMVPKIVDALRSSTPQEPVCKHEGRYDDPNCCGKCGHMIAQESDDDALIRGLRRSAQIVREAGLVNSATFMERAANRLQAKAPETDHDGIVVVDEADFTQGEE